MEKKNIVKLVLAGFVLFVVLLITSLPARFVLGHVGQALPGMFYADGIEGTIWAGSANSVLISVQGNTIDLGRASWELDAMPLLWGSVALQLSTHAEQQSIKTNATLGMSALSLEDTDIHLPAKYFSKALPIPVGLDGDIQVHLNEFELSINDIVIKTLDGTFLWQQAAINLTGAPVLLGVYKADLMIGSDGEYLALVSDDAAVLSVNGTISIQPKTKRYKVDLKLKPARGLDPMFSTMISQLGRPGPDGSVPLTSSGPL